MRKTTFITSSCILLILMCGSFTLGGTNYYTIPIGTATVDGDSSDWADAIWNEGTLQTGYWTGASIPGNEDVNIPNTKFAVRWQDDDPVAGTPGRLYAIAIVEQTELELLDSFTEWCATDRLEWFVHGPNAADEAYNANFYAAQQYVMSPKASDNSQCWVECGYKHGTPTDNALDVEAAVSVSGSTITYEVSLPVYDSWEGFDGNGTTVIADLAPGVVVGFDLLVGSGIAPYVPGLTYPEYAKNYYLLDETGISAGTAHKADGLSSVMLTYTLEGVIVPGDANRDGVVDAEDAGIMADNWLSGPDAGWRMGDFNGDGYVNDLDAALLAANWSGTGASSQVPEPAVKSLLLALGGFFVWKKLLFYFACSDLSRRNSRCGKQLESLF